MTQDTDRPPQHLRPEVQPGEIINITIKGARVAEEQAGWLSFFVDDDTRHSVEVGSPSVTVERVAPAQWPPRAGDLWRDRYGETWFARMVDDDTADEPYVVLMPARTSVARWSEDDEVALQSWGPLTLVHREDEQDGGAS